MTLPPFALPIACSSILKPVVSAHPQSAVTGAFVIAQPYQWLKVNNYAEATGRRATVQVATSRDGELLTRTLDVGPQRRSSGDDAPITVFKVTVTKDAEDNYKVTAN